VLLRLSARRPLSHRQARGLRRRRRAQHEPAPDPSVPRLRPHRRGSVVVMEQAKTSARASRGSVSFGALVVTGAAALVLGLALSAVHAGDPPAPPRAPRPAAPDPMTAEGQRALADGF